MWKDINVLYAVHLERDILFYRGFRPKPRLTFCLATKSKQKSQDSARLTRKTGARKAKIPKLLPTVVKQWVFFRFPYLFFSSPDEVTR
jgi:hypothetical protein